MTAPRLRTRLLCRWYTQTLQLKKKTNLSGNTVVKLHQVHKRSTSFRQKGQIHTTPLQHQTLQFPRDIKKIYFFNAQKRENVTQRQHNRRPELKDRHSLKKISFLSIYKMLRDIYEIFTRSFQGQMLAYVGERTPMFNIMMPQINSEICRGWVKTGWIEGYELIFSWFLFQGWQLGSSPYEADWWIFGCSSKQERCENRLQQRPSLAEKRGINPSSLKKKKILQVVAVAPKFSGYLQPWAFAKRNTWLLIVTGGWSLTPNATACAAPSVFSARCKQVEQTLPLCLKNGYLKESPAKSMYTERQQQECAHSDRQPFWQTRLCRARGKHSACLL